MSGDSNLTDGAQRGGASGGWLSKPSVFSDGNIREFFRHLELYWTQHGVDKEDWVTELPQFLDSFGKQFLKAARSKTDSQWLKVKEEMMKLFPDDEDTESPTEVAEAFLAKPLEPKRAVKQLMQLETILESVTEWGDDAKKLKLVKFVPHGWCVALSASISGNESLATLFDKFLKHAKDINVKTDWLRTIRAEADDSVPETSGPKVESTRAEVTLRKGPAPPAQTNVDSLTDDLRMMVLRVIKEEVSSPSDRGSPPPKSCYYCSGRHRMGDCAILNDDLRAGIVRRDANNILVSAEGLKIPRYNDAPDIRSALLKLLSIKASASAAGSSPGVHQVNDVRLLELHEESEEPHPFHVDVGRKRVAQDDDDQPDILRDERGIPIVQAARPVARVRQQSAAAEVAVATEQDTADQAVATDPVMNRREPPSFRVKAPVELPPFHAPIDAAMRDATISLPVYNFLGMSREGADFLRKITTRRRVATEPAGQRMVNQVVAEPTAEGSRQPAPKRVPRFAKKSVHVWGTVLGERVAVVIDAGSELNLGNLEWLREKSYPVFPEANAVMVGITNHSQGSKDVAMQVPVQLNRALWPVDLLAVPGFKYKLLLGLPFLEQADWSVGIHEGVRSYIVTDGRYTIRFPTAAEKDEADCRTVHECGLVQQDDWFPDGEYAVNL
ncbi:hypothetical protein GGI12_005553, partial [Dipsacomyces acuminosporus]